MLPQLAYTRRESQAGRLLAVVAVALLLVVAVPMGGGLVAGLGFDSGDTHSGVALAQTEDAPSGTGQGPVSTGDNSEDTSDDASGNESAEDSGEVGGDTIEEGDTPAGAGQGVDGETESPGSGQDQGVGENTSSVEGVVSDPDDAEVGNSTIENGSTPAGAGQGSDGTPVGNQTPAGGQGQGAAGTAAEDGTPTASDDDDSGVGFVAQQILDMIEGLTAQMSSEFGELVSQMFELAVSRSAPGVADDPSTWSNPEDPMWQGAVDVTELTRFMGGAIVLIAAFYSILEFFKDPRSSKRRIKWCIIAGVYLLKPTFWNGLTLHFSNTVSTTILPEGEVFATPEGALLVGLTVIVGGLLASASLLVIALAAFVTVVAHSAGYPTTMFLPLALSFYCMNMYMRSLGEMVVYLHGVTIFMPIFQALAVLSISRMALGSSGILGSLSGVLMFLGMIYLVFYLFQKEVLEKAFDAPITSLGVHGAQMGVSGAINAKSTVQNAPEMFKNMKAGIEANIEGVKSRFSGSDGFSRPNIGVLQSQGTSRQSAAAVADGGYNVSSSSKGADATSNTFPPEGDRGFQAIEENRERDRLSHGDY